jgi:broad specificity phosphatase PhoE
VPADEPAAAALPDLTGWLGRSGTVVTSPARRCAVPGAVVDERLGPWDLGTWNGRPWRELDLPSWRTDPSYDAHGGESLEGLAGRVSRLLREWSGNSGRLAAITHGAVIKCAVVQALRAPIEAVWDLDVAHSSVTELHVSGSSWRVTRVGCLIHAHRS